MNVQLSLTLNDVLYSKIEDLSVKMNIGTNELVISALKKFLVLQDIKLTRKKLKNQLLKHGIKSEKDIFDSVS